MRPLKPSQAYAFAQRALRMNRVPYLSGPAGIGKSSIAAQIADEFNLKLIDIRLSQMLPEDMMGLPQIEGDRASYKPFTTFPLAEFDKVPDGFDGWLILLDELSSASEEVMAAAYSIILDRLVGGRQIHAKARIMAAGNRSTDSAIARPLPDTLITRMLCIEMKPSVKDWMRWAENICKAPNEHTMAFIKKHPSMLHDLGDSSKRSELEPYPNARGWEAVMTAINAHQRITGKDSPMDEVTLHTVEAAVGSIAGTTYKEDYDQALTLPKPWDCAQAPAATHIPPSAIGKSTLTKDLVKYYLESGDGPREGVIKYMNRIGGEFSSLFAQLAAEQMGQTASEVALLANLKKELNINDLNFDDEFLKPPLPKKPGVKPGSKPSTLKPVTKGKKSTPVSSTPVQNIVPDFDADMDIGDEYDDEPFD